MLQWGKPRSESQNTLQVRILSQVFMILMPVLNLKMIFLSPPREDESRERNGVPMKEGQQMRVWGRWPAKEGSYISRQGKAKGNEAVLAILKHIAKRFLGILLDNQGQRERAVLRLEQFRPPGTRGKLASECGSQGDSRASSATQCLEGRRKGRGTLATLQS